MTAELVIRRPCESCGQSHPDRRIVDAGCFGTGGTEERLDPGRYLVLEDKEFDEVVLGITVRDVLDALGDSDG